MPIPPPPPYQNVDSDPPSSLQGHLEGEKQQAFRNEERSEEIVTNIIFKLILENMKNCKWRKLVVPPNMTEQRIVTNWNLEE